MYKFFLIFLLFLPTLPAQERREPHKSIQISKAFFSGEYLIYDCQKGFFACVDEFGFQDCQAARDHSIEVGKKNLPCAPLKKFPYFEDCENAQKKEIESPKQKVFCFLKTSKNY